MVSASKNKEERFLPKEYYVAHELCFMIHDAMVQIIKSGEEGDFFKTTIYFNNDDERESFELTDDIFSWFVSEKRLYDRARVLRTIVLPAVLSDMMHCVFESLETSRKAKLGVSYMLIRKPLQESLYLLESIVLDEFDFAEKLAEDPLKLRSHTVGGVEPHGKRIKQVIDIIGESDRFDSAYIAQLRYDKKQEDSFDGVCNHAMHLFTQHPSILTENLNINFVFSGWGQKMTQWSYLYSRLPYLFFYTYLVVEKIVEKIAPTTQQYLDDIQRRISAQVLLWWDGVDEQYKCTQLENFVSKTKSWLLNHCESAGYKFPNIKELHRMSKNGAFPKEGIFSIKFRNIKYRLVAAKNRKMANR